MTLKEIEAQDSLHAMIRVNQAGEFGATRIYAGQLAILKGTPSEKSITEMAAQEAEHLKQFNRLIIEHKVRPTILSPLWHIGGYALGALTGLLGEKAAHACTIAVEEVIDDHYKNQLAQLPDKTAPLFRLIEQCRQDELAHKNTAVNLGGNEAPAYALLTEAIKAISRTAIWLSSRI
jgi:ubiquinone biosynthesis monooxygenase Coq7